MTTLLLVATVTAFCAAASSHATINPKEGPTGHHILKVRIPHDCGDETIGTMNVTTIMPKGVASVKIEQVDGWRGSFTMRETDIDEYPETVDTVTYLGFLPDGYYREFGLSLRVLEAPRGTVLYFPIIQECHGESEPIYWTMIPKEGSTEYLDRPAPSFVIT